MLEFKTKLSLVVAPRPMYKQGGASPQRPYHPPRAGSGEAPDHTTLHHPYTIPSYLQMCTPLKYL